MTDKERIAELTAQVSKNIEAMKTTREQLTATIAESEAILNALEESIPIRYYYQFHKLPF